MARPAHHSARRSLGRHRRNRRLGILSRLGLWRAIALRLAIVLAFALATMPLTIGSASAAVTSVDIDGDQAGATNDWQGLAGTGDVSVIEDGISPDDSTGIRAQEDTQPWTAQTSQASG